jgi:hypothetical protein
MLLAILAVAVATPRIQNVVRRGTRAFLDIAREIGYHPISIPAGIQSPAGHLSDYRSLIPAVGSESLLTRVSRLRPDLVSNNRIHGLRR